MRETLTRLRYLLIVLVLPIAGLLSAPRHADAHPYCIYTYSYTPTPGSSYGNCCNTWDCSDGSSGSSCAACAAAKNHGEPDLCNPRSAPLLARDRRQENNPGAMAEKKADAAGPPTRSTGTGAITP